MDRKMEEKQIFPRLSWERLPGESSKAYAAFCVYRDYGIDRSVTRVLQRYHEKYGSRSLLSRWSQRYNWVKRCHDYDVHLEQEFRKELHAAYLDMTKRHIAQAKLMQEKALEALEAIDPTTLTNLDLLRYLEIGMKLEKDMIIIAHTQDGLHSIDNDQTGPDPIGKRLSAEMLERTKRLLGEHYEETDSHEAV